MAYTVGSVAMYDFFANLPTLGTTGEIYFCNDTNLYYQWNGSAYASFPVVGAPRVNSVVSSATPTINVATTDLFKVTALAVAITGFTITGTPVDGQQLRVRIIDNGTARALAWGASFVGGTTALLTTTVISKQHTSTFVYDSVKAAFVCVQADAAGV